MTTSKYASKTQPSRLLKYSLSILLIFICEGVTAFSTLSITNMETSSTALLQSSIAIPPDGGTSIPQVRIEKPKVAQKQVESPANIEKLSGFSELGSVLNDIPQNELTVVFYHANYCKICQRAQIKYKKLASMASEKAQFTSMEASKIPAADLKSLGINRFPWIQIWRNRQCVSALAPGASYSSIPRVMESLEKCRDRSRTEWLEMAPRLQVSQDALDKLCEE